MAVSGAAIDGNHDELLGVLTALRADLRKRLGDDAPAPIALANDIGRLFDALDASIDKLREIIRMRA